MGTVRTGLGLLSGLDIGRMELLSSSIGTGPLWTCRMGMGLGLLLRFGLGLFPLLEEAGCTSMEHTELALVDLLYDQAALPFRPRTLLQPT